MMKSAILPANVDMLEPEENTVKFIDINPKVTRNSAPVEALIQIAAQNGGKDFNIFVTSSESLNIP